MKVSREEVVDYYIETKKYIKEIADHFGISPTTVGKYLRNEPNKAKLKKIKYIMALNDRDKNIKPKRKMTSTKLMFDYDTQKSIREDFKKGLFIKDLIKKYNYSYTAISNFLHKEANKDTEVARLLKANKCLFSNLSRKVVRVNELGIVEAEFNSISEAAESILVCPNTIKNNIKKKTACKGYFYEYR